jgi:hypothetical protein
LTILFILHAVAKAAKGGFNPPGKPAHSNKRVTIKQAHKGEKMIAFRRIAGLLCEAVFRP